MPTGDQFALRLYREMRRVTDADMRTPDRLHGELGGVARDPDADEAGIGGHIVHPIEHDLAELLIFEVVDVHAQWGAFRTIIGSAILEVAHQLLLLCVDGDDGLLVSLRRNDFRVNIFELGIAVGMFGAFIHLTKAYAMLWEVVSKGQQEPPKKPGNSPSENTVDWLGRIAEIRLPRAAISPSSRTYLRKASPRVRPLKYSGV